MVSSLERELLFHICISSLIISDLFTVLFCSAASATYMPTAKPARKRRPKLLEAKGNERSKRNQKMTDVREEMTYVDDIPAVTTYCDVNVMTYVPHTHHTYINHVMRDCNACNNTPNSLSIVYYCCSLSVQNVFVILYLFLLQYS